MAEKKKLKTMVIKFTAVFLLVNMVVQVCSTGVAYALTSGPANPEFSSFEPVSTTSMVNEFSGDFTYNLPVVNIPGPDGGGYSLSLSYHSGEAVESEASWVGFGWTLNPGSINRNKKGVPDDFLNPDRATNNDIVYYNKVPKSWTVTSGANAGRLEIYSYDLQFSPSADISLRYNNYKGFGYTAGVGLSYRKGIMTLGYSVSDGSGSFSLKVNPAALMNQHNKNYKEEKNKSEQKDEQGKAETKEARKARLQKAIDKDNAEANEKGTGFASYMGMAANYGIKSLGDNSTMISNLTAYEGRSINFAASIDFDPSPASVGIEVGLYGSYSEQKNVPATGRDIFGYMYSHEAGSDGIMDYYIEKDAPYSKRDQYLPVPHSGADQFLLTGEGLAGGFRLHSKEVGHFHPPQTSSSIDISQQGVEFQGGLNVAVGADKGIGAQSLGMYANWSSGQGNTNSYTFSTGGMDEKYFMSFNNDLASMIDYGSDNEKVSAHVSGLKPFIPELRLSKKISVTEENGNRVPRSSYILYRTNTELNSRSGGSTSSFYYRNDASRTTGSLINRGEGSISNHIGELSIYNDQGNQYVYGLPVYSRNEKLMQVSLENSNVLNNHLAYLDNPQSFNQRRMVVGEDHQYAYANTYLLTQITTPDYIDVDLAFSGTPSTASPGPSDGDFGGWTKFMYKRVHGGYLKKGIGGWYRWRMPYSGLNYSMNQMSNNEDDMGTYSSGEKEVYYLDKIETKTHVAVFVTNNTDFYLGDDEGFNDIHIEGSGDDRLDGLEAEPDDNAFAAPPGPSALGSLKKLEKLEKIMLFSKSYKINSGGSSQLVYKLVKTTNFEYDYQVWRGTPNSSAPTTQGKLTLTKVWFEYNNVKRTKISPYKFEYKYHDTDNDPYPAPYDATDLNASTDPAVLTQDPPYSVYALDAWGNYQMEDTQRDHDLKKGVNQLPDSKFDPAAWQLKKIVFPSGGEIHVQYEQDEYLFVQNRRAMSLVDIERVSGFLSSYKLNISGSLPVTGPFTYDPQKHFDLIKTYLADDYLYFKFLYTLIGGQEPDIGNCSADYIDGYLPSAECSLGTGNLFISLLGGSDYYPQKICKDWVKANGGMLKPFDNCNAQKGIPENDPLDLVQQLLSKFGTTLFPNLLNCCSEIREELSYFKIPVYYAKKGGGLRVKAILMYDNGFDSGVKELYGSRYHYVKEDGVTSSGVATNEPASIREENPLIGYLAKRSSQTAAGKIIAGKDKEQFEGPMGESLLPSPNVGYSRVVVENIHRGQSNPGFTVSEFFTTYDYPFDKHYDSEMLKGSGADHTEIDSEPLKYFVPGWLINVNVDNFYLAQGYRFVITAMNGQPKTISTYAGKYDDLSSYKLSSQTSYTYFEPGERVPVLKNIYSPLEYVEMGKETEYIIEKRAVEDVSTDCNIEFDAGAQLVIIPVPFGSAFPSLAYTENKLNSHVITKVISYPAIQKSMQVYKDGVYHLTENLAFSPDNGSPVWTRTTDGYHNLSLGGGSAHKGFINQLTFKASEQYPEMGAKSFNNGKKMASDPSGVGVGIDLEFPSQYEYYLAFTSGSSNSSLCDLLNSFNKGDLIKVSKSGAQHFFNVSGLNGNKVKLLYNDLYNSPPTTFPNSLTDVSIEIVNSGRTNQLTADAGSLTTYGELDISTTGGIGKVLYTAGNSEIVKRGVFAEMLTDAINTLSNGATTTIYGTDLNSGALEGLELLMSDGNCRPVCDDDLIRITKDPDGKKVHIELIGFGGSAYETIEMCNEKDLAVQKFFFTSYLNYYLNKLMTFFYSGKPSLGGNPDYKINETFVPGLGFYYELVGNLPQNTDCPDCKISIRANLVPTKGFGNLSSYFSGSSDPGDATPPYDKLTYWEYANSIGNSIDPFAAATGVTACSNCTSTIPTIPTSSVYSYPRASVIQNAYQHSLGTTYDDFGDFILDNTGVYNFDINFTSSNLPNAVKLAKITPAEPEFPDYQTPSFLRVLANEAGASYAGYFTNSYGQFALGSYDIDPSDDDLSYCVKIHYAPKPGAYQYMQCFSPNNNCMFRNWDIVEDMFPDSDPRSQALLNYILKPCNNKGCIIEITPDGSEFEGKINLENGALEIYTENNQCVPYDLGCFKLCPMPPLTTKLNNVLAATAKTYNDVWYYPGFMGKGSNLYAEGLHGKWRELSNYVYKTGTYRGNENTITGTDNARTFKAALSDQPGGVTSQLGAGTFKQFGLFDWKLGDSNPGDNNGKWIRLNTITLRDRNGTALEEKDVLDIYGATKYGYQNTLPYLVAKNAKYRSVMFESFENPASYIGAGGGFMGNTFEDGVFVASSDATLDYDFYHSGKASLKYKNTSTDGIRLNYISFDNTSTGERQYSVKLWAKSTNSSGKPVEISATALKFEVDLKNITGTSGKVQIPFVKVARSGEWVLYEAILNMSSSFTSSGGTPIPGLNNPASSGGLPTISTPAVSNFVLPYIKYNGSDNLWIDDLRIQPTDAQMNAYVYDKATQKLLTSFDDQHFGLYYQYNAEGKLIRKMVETEKGKRIVQETQYNTPEEAR